MKNHQLINQDSGDVEYYTPQEIVEAARRVMGHIDLDPASSEIANQRVKAARFYTVDDDGLNKPWQGRIWLNHPFGRTTNGPWMRKIEQEYRGGGGMSEAICITFAATSEKWFAPLLRQPQCFLSPRTNYFLPDGTLKRGVTKGSVVTYFGNNVAAFSREFSGMGVIKVPYFTT